MASIMVVINEAGLAQIEIITGLALEAVTLKVLVATAVVTRYASVLVMQRGAGGRGSSSCGSCVWHLGN